MTPKTRDLLQRCLEDGIALGLARAHKHSDEANPPRLSWIETCIYDDVMTEIDEWFTFTNPFPESDK